MNQALALSLLSDIMEWNEERATEEFAWLQLMSRFKYDEYADYVAGVRFIESLAYWLQQFQPAERAGAYAFVRNALIYMSEAEIQHLVELVYPNMIQPIIVEQVAEALRVPKYLVWSRKDAELLYRNSLRRSLFFGLSDGARIDVFRRAAVGTISNEQVLLAPEIHPDKWDRLLGALRKELGSDNDKFKFIFLLDDFTGSGYTLGNRLRRFWDIIKVIKDTHLSPDWCLFVHHYLATQLAVVEVKKNQEQTAKERGADWYPSVDFSYGLILRNELKVSEETAPDLWPLIQKYYNKKIQTTHTDKGGSEDIRLGFGQCALPLVLEHNTPNNSIALLWAETEVVDGQPIMRPLFRRRQRHTEPATRP